jgi:hypothetical protein
MRCDVRHEFDRVMHLRAHFALVHVAGQRVRHQVVAQLPGIVLVRRRRACPRITGDAEALHGTVQHIEHRRDRKLHRRGVAARIADAALAGVACAGQFGQAVVPARVEAIVGGQIDDHRIGLVREVERGHACGRLAVRQREHDGIGAERREVFMRRRAVAQFTGVGRLERRHALARALARGHVGEIELRMPADQLDQLGAHVPRAPTMPTVFLPLMRGAPGVP